MSESTLVCILFTLQLRSCVYDCLSQASVAELDRTIEQLQIRVEQNGDSQEDFERTCERMRSDLQTSYEVDLRRAA
jgi:hypothetical protein